MGKIITVHVGQCGTAIGREFWRDIAAEHAIQLNSGLFHAGASRAQRTNVDVYFDTCGGRHVPRAILVDLEPGTLDSIRASDIGRLFRPDNVIAGDSGAGNNFAKGFYTVGQDFIESTMDTVRREVELCDTVAGFQITHSLGGGTGSGMGSLILEQLKNEFPDRIVCTYSVFPSPLISNIIVEPYNTILAASHLCSVADLCVTFDNDALLGICQKQQKLFAPTFADMNGLISRAMTGITASHRFPGQINSSLRKLCVNLVPFPRLHFLTCACAPLGMQTYERPMHARELIAQLMAPNTMMCSLDPQSGKFLTATTLCRGAVSSLEVDAELAALLDRKSSLFVPWLPNSATASVCNEPSCLFPVSATLLGNSTAIGCMLENHRVQFDRLRRRKAYLHWYTGEGMDESEFDEANSNILDLLSEYSQYESASLDSAEAEAEPEVALQHSIAASAHQARIDSPRPSFSSAPLESRTTAQCAAARDDARSIYASRVRLQPTSPPHSPTRASAATRPDSDHGVTSLSNSEPWHSVGSQCGALNSKSEVEARDIHSVHAARAARNDALNIDTSSAFDELSIREKSALFDTGVGSSSFGSWPEMSRENKGKRHFAASPDHLAAADASQATHSALPPWHPNQRASPTMQPHAPKVRDSDLNYALAAETGVSFVSPTSPKRVFEQSTFQPYVGGSPQHAVSARAPATKATALPPWHPTSHPSQTLEPHGRHMRESDLHSVLAARTARSLASPPLSPLPTHAVSQSDFHPNLARSPRRDMSPTQAPPTFVMGRRSPSPLPRPWRPSSAAGVIGAANLQSALAATALHDQGVVDRGVRDTDHVAALLAGQWHSVPVVDSAVIASAKDLEHEIEAMDRQSVADAEIARLTGHRREA